jgi:glucitol operon activator protein
MTTVITLIGAIAGGMVVQMFLTIKQTNAFTKSVRDLRKQGTVSIGGGGKRYRGGKAFVAIAADDNGRVTKAVSMSGWTTFARPTELHHVQGLRLTQLRSDEPIPLIGSRERSALQNAAETLHAHLVKAA